MALGVSLTQPTTVIAAFVADLTGSTIWVGGLSTVLTVAGVLPQLCGSADKTPAAQNALSDAGNLPAGVLLPVFVLAEATFNGRQAGFQSALLELAPAGQRPTYSALNAAMTLPVAFLPLLAGLLLQSWPYPLLFAVAAGFVALGAVWTRRLPASRPAAV